MIKQICCFVFLSAFLSINAQDDKFGLSHFYKDHFLVGTIYHGDVLGNDNPNLNQKQEFKIIKNEFIFTPHLLYWCAKHPESNHIK